MEKIITLLMLIAVNGYLFFFGDDGKIKEKKQQYLHLQIGDKY